jgi:peptidoglycan/LPS O-acetylase OafA/YrhL
MPTPDVKPVYLPHIDGIRAIAVLAVVLFHAFPTLFPAGFIGVDIFFVISGYLITKITLTDIHQHTFSIQQFYARRVKRIFPALSCVLLFSLAWGYFKLTPAEFEQLGKHVAGGSAFVDNILLYKESGYFDTSALTKPLLHLWSLGVEEQFYILWPLLAVLLHKAPRLFLPSLGIMCVASFLANITFSVGDPGGLFYLPFYRGWELLSGSALAVFQRQQGRTSSPYIQLATPWLGVFLLLISLATINQSSPYPGWLTLLPVCAAALLISDESNQWFKTKLLSNKLMIWIGKISYPLYLWHWPIFTFAYLQHDTQTLSFNVITSLIFLSVLLAHCTYRLIESPIRAHLSPRHVVITLSITMFIIFMFGIFIKSTNGVPQRFPHKVKDIATFEFNYSDYRRGLCFLDEDQYFRDMPSSTCLSANQATKESVWLWGDSHAASLYPGLKEQLETKSNWATLSQFTSSGCPPFLETVKSWRGNCQKNNEFVMQMIRQHHPDTVILSGYWLTYGEKESLESLKATIHFLQENNVGHIIIVGPFPNWRLSVPKVILTIWTRTGEVMDYSNKYMDMRPLELNKAMQALGALKDVTFISATERLCEQNQCRLLLTQNGHEYPVQWDKTHLSTEASRWLADQIASDLIK